jgi:hypothetical protein
VGDYHKPAAAVTHCGLTLDPYYEAKCLPFMEPDDLLWIVGIRQSADRVRDDAAVGNPTWVCGDSRSVTAAAPPADLIFTCPPYADLERYSDDPRDLSAMPWPGFLAAYRDIIRAACAKLRPDRFAAIVVGDVRGPDGAYRNLPGETVRAFIDAGLRLYNEAVFETPVGSLPIRIGAQFSKSRKFGKTHQNLYVFVKGDPKAATRAIPMTTGGA